MKNHTKKKLMLLILGFIFGFSILININSNYYQEIDDELELKRTGYWELSSIYIDDDSYTSNWSITAATYDWCSGSGTWNDPYIIANVTVDGGGSGNSITIRDSTVYFIIYNSTVYNSLLWGDRGIYLYNVNNSWLSKNTVYNNFRGIELENSNNNTLSSNTANSNEDTGIYLKNSNNNILSNNTANFIIGSGREIGILLDNSNNNTVWQNTANNNDVHGIAFQSNSDNNTVWNNTVRYNDQAGISLGESDYNTIELNYATKNYDLGIFLHECYYNDFLRNEINDNYGMGMALSDSKNNTISGNTIKNNNGIGINLYDTKNENNNIADNYISDNSVGVVLDGRVKNNLIYNNEFDGGGGTYAVDSSYDINYWDNGSLGNYWDDYTGSDSDNNGIGDTPYNIQGSAGHQDNYPIWWDPVAISINSPNSNEFFEWTAPNFAISIDNGVVFDSWYTIDGGLTNITFTGTTGSINQTEWDKKSDGLITIIFYAMNACFKITSSQVNIIKDTTAPKITINAPTPNQLCGSIAPSFSLTIVEPNPLEKRYSLNGRPNITFTTETQISQSEWNNVGNGTVLITFYVEDKVGNINSSEVIVRKDIFVPEVTIISPIEDGVFENIAPSFTVDIQDANLDKMWYTLHFGAQEVPFTSNDTIDQGLWDALTDGIVTLTFFANDTVGNINFTSVNIIKDTLLPEILILSPNLNDIFGINPPTFELSINESNLESTWYTIDGGITNYTFSGLTGVVNQTAWIQKGTELITIIFYAIDSLGHIGFQDVQISKDLINPVIFIHLPLENEIFGNTPPDFNISITEENLVSTWYIIQGSTTQYPFTGVTGTISQEAWDHAIEGDVTITFYAQDRAGNIGIESVTIIKNIPSQPSIPGYNLFVLLGVLSVAIIIIERKWRNLRG